MRNRTLLALAASACLGVGLLAAPADAAPPPKGGVVYHLVDIGTVLSGATDTTVTGVIPYDDSTDPTVAWRAVGTYRDTAGRHGFLADLHADFSLASADPIDVAGSVSVHVTSVNATGTIAGYYRAPTPGSEVERGFLRAQDGTITDLDHPLAETLTRQLSVSPAAPSYGDQFFGGTYPMQVADDGTVTGFYSVPNPDSGMRLLHGFTWTAAAGFNTVDVPKNLATAWFGTTSAGLKYGGTTVPVPKTSLANDRGVTLAAKTGKATYYVDTAVVPSLPGNFCGWTTVTGIKDSSTLVGDAGNGCSISGYAWLLRGSKYTDLKYTEGSTTATETIVTGITTGGLMTGSWSTWPFDNGPGDWLNPDGYTLAVDEDYNPILIPHGAGWWQGFIAVVT